MCVRASVVMSSSGTAVRRVGVQRGLRRECSEMSLAQEAFQKDCRSVRTDVLHSCNDAMASVLSLRSHPSATRRIESQCLVRHTLSHCVRKQATRLLTGNGNRAAACRRRSCVYLLRRCVRPLRDRHPLQTLIAGSALPPQREKRSRSIVAPVNPGDRFSRQRLPFFPAFNGRVESLFAVHVNKASSSFLQEEDPTAHVRSARYPPLAETKISQATGQPDSGFPSGHASNGKY